MGLGTPLHETHLRSAATFVDFGGWDMPLHYGSQIAEHRAVRQDAGMFDVSHMGIVDVTGYRVRDFLRTLLANDIGKLDVPGRALYSCMLLPSGGVIDDLLVYFMAEQQFRLVVNAGTRTTDLRWIIDQGAAYEVNVAARSDLAMIAVQGPHARAKTASLLRPAQRAAALGLRPFAATTIDSWYLARTGYTGEDGFEMMLPAEDAAATWQALLEAGVAPAGLGARDTLRLEAGFSLYGNDLDRDHHPLESGVEWTVAFEPPEREFVGRAALERARAAGSDRLVGLLLEQRGVLRSHQKVIVDDAATGEITSGSFSPTLNRSIALARVRSGVGARVQVDIRGRLHAARVVKPPFVRHGRVLVQV